MSYDQVVRPFGWSSAKNAHLWALWGVGFAGTKDRRVNIRLSSADVRSIQALALREGIPHQTLIASVLHRYVTGRLVERS